MDRGYVKLWRKLEDSEILYDPATAQLVMYMLVKAAWKRTPIAVSIGRGMSTMTLEPGQLIYGREAWAKRLGMAPKVLRNRMDRLEKCQFLARQRATHCSVVTLCNWDTYQTDNGAGGQAKGHQTAIKRPSNGHIERSIACKNHTEKAHVGEENGQLPGLTQEKPVTPRQDPGVPDEFEAARKEYPGAKRGSAVEWANFAKKRSKTAIDAILPELLPAVRRYRAFLSETNANRQPGHERPAKNFATWINNDYWTEELPAVERRLSQSERLRVPAESEYQNLNVEPNF